jgi:NAD+ kinase
VKSIGFVINPVKEGALELGAELISWLNQKGVKTPVEDESARLIGQEDKADSLEAVCEAEMVVVLGGDGTILRVARTAGPKGTPMLGVHFGQYGFITEIHPPDAKQALERILEDDYLISERIMLNAKLIRDDQILHESPALNDVVVAKGPLARILKLHTFVNDRLIATYAADGIIVSSPTGSTAYALSAGGPVINPNVKVMVITPICPHTLNARSLVIPDSESVQIVAECRDGVGAIMLTIDGQFGIEMRCSDKMDIRRADFTARIVYWDKMGFYDKLHSRLGWGERFST